MFASLQPPELLGGDAFFKKRLPYHAFGKQRPVRYLIYNHATRAVSGEVILVNISVSALLYELSESNSICMPPHFIDEEVF